MKNVNIDVSIFKISNMLHDCDSQPGVNPIRVQPNTCSSHCFILCVQQEAFHIVEILNVFVEWMGE